MIDLLALLAGLSVGVVGAIALAGVLGGKPPLRVAAASAPAAPAVSPNPAVRTASDPSQGIRVNHPGVTNPAAAPPAAAAAPVRPAAPAGPARAAGTTGARLEAADGTDPVELGDEVITIGRGTDQRLRVPDSRVSRAHAVVRPRRKGGWEVRDVGSSNGTQLNGHTIPEDRVAPLRHGDRITVGPATFTYTETSGGRPSPPPAAPGPDPTRVL